MHFAESTENEQKFAAQGGADHLWHESKVGRLQAETGKRILERGFVLKKQLSRQTLYRTAFLIVVIMLLIFAARPANAASVKKITLLQGNSRQLKRAGAVWTSSRPLVVSVNETGLVTGLSKGKSTITATVGKKKYRYKIKVEVPVLSSDTVNIKLKKSKTLKVTGTTKKFTFTSSDPSVVKVIRKSKTKVKLKALKSGHAVITVSRGATALTCKVATGDAINTKEGSFSLYYNGTAIQTLTYTKSDVGKYVTSISSFGQSAPLYVSVNGGDGLESIFAETNNGNVNVAGVQLPPEAVQGTIAKACLWARAVCDSQYHGYDDGQVHEIDCWGIAKSNAPGTGDYCCFSLTESAYYFAGVNLLGECLGNPEAAIYPPYSTMLFEHGGISFWGDTKPRSTAPFDSTNVYPKAGFVEITQQRNMAGDSFVYEAGDICVSAHSSHQHEQLIIKSGTKDNCEVAEACGPGSGGRQGGDQSGGELCVYSKLYQPSEVNHVYRFTGAGVVLNTVGLVG